MGEEKQKTTSKKRCSATDDGNIAGPSAQLQNGLAKLDL